VESRRDSRLCPDPPNFTSPPSISAGLTDLNESARTAEFDSFMIESGLEHGENSMTLEMGELTVGKTATNLVDEIKKLSSQDRAAIVVEVLDTLEEEGEEFDDQVLLRELERREVEGMTDSVPWSVLRDMS
jgi:hypothetical protein